MTPIDQDTSPEELAALVSKALADAGISATLSGGAAVTLYSLNEYQSYDLDFVTMERMKRLEEAIGPLGFTKVTGARQFSHPDTDYCVEFPPGPLAFGETMVPDEAAATIDTRFGPVRIVTPTQSVMDRLAAYAHWNDRQSLDQAVMVARRHQLNWTELLAWAANEGLGPEIIERLKARSQR